MDTTLRQAITSLTLFSLRLSTHLLSLPGFSDSNLVFSPISLHSSLCLLAAGSTGPTLEQLLYFLGSDDVYELSALHNHVSSVLLADGSAVGGPHLSYAAGIWVDDHINLTDSFREIARSAYKAKLHPVPFHSMPEECRNQINKWVEQKTAGHIRGLLAPGTVTFDTRLVLANALYFNARWSEKFDPVYTRSNTFHLIDGSSIKTSFMSSRESQFITVYDDFKVLKLPYKQEDSEQFSSNIFLPKENDSRQFSFYIFLPSTLDGLLILSKKLSSEPDFLNRHIPTRRVPVRNFRIPKFNMSKEIEFSEILQNQGLALPFRMTGDFSEMVDSPEIRKFRVSKIAHKCFVGVNEERTEAAAATAILMVGCAQSMEEPIDFVADHPFVFLIREEMSGVVLFVGHLFNPDILTD